MSALLKKVTLLLICIGTIVMSLLFFTKKQNAVSEVMYKDVPQNFSGETSLRNVILSTTPIQCSYKQDISEISSDGIIYVNGNIFKYESSSITQGKFVIQSHFVSDGSIVYFWSNISSQGVKMLRSEFFNSSNYLSGPGSIQWMLDRILPMNCEALKTEEITLKIPEFVVFN